MNVTFDLDERSWRQITVLASFEPHWHDHMYDELSSRLAKDAEEYFKPMVRSVRGTGTGESEASVRHEIERSADGWDVFYYGNLGAFYMDEGNFSPDATIYRSNQMAFPVGMREGATEFFSPYIHGMGHRTAGVPTHYSEKTAEWLESDKAASIALESMERWLDSVVIGS